MVGAALIPDLGKIIVFLLLLLAFFLLTAKSERKLPNYIFASFLLVTALDLVGLFITQTSSLGFESLRMSSVLLQMPLYWLYVQSACYYNYQLESKHLLHGLPALGFFSFFIVSNISVESIKLFDVVAQLQYYAYIIAVFLSLRTFRILYQENYSANHHLTFRWLLQTTILFLIGNSFVLLRDIASSGESLDFLPIINLVISVFALCVISWFVLKALYHPKLFLGVDKNLRPIQSDQVVHPTEYKAELDRLADYMQTEKPYLDAELSLQKLAAGLSLPDKQVSQLINQQLGKHFFDYINEFRINEAKALLKDQSDLTVLEILYQVGFNSKSSFYTAFKKETGQTPTNYRKSAS